MKLQILIAACLAVAAFAAPMPQFVDPDCVEEDLAVEEPAQEIEADFALGLPDLIINFGDNTKECEDDIVEPTAAPLAPAATEECEDPITTEEIELAPTEAECVDEPIEVTTEEATPAPTPAAAPTAAECEEEFETTAAPVEEAPADECVDDEEANEVAPELSIRIEPASVVEDIKMYGEEHMIPEIEECEE